MSNRAPIISLSGPDGSGKSTVIETLVRRLKETGEQPTVVWSRLGYTPGFERLKANARRLLGKRIPQQGDSKGRTRLMNRSRVKGPWLFLACADLARTYGSQLRRLASKGTTVVCDRYVWDAIIDRQIYYPDANWGETMIRRSFALVGVQPDLSYLLSLPLEIAKQRSETKDEPFPDSPDIRTARHALYSALETDSALRVLDATRSPEELVDQIEQDLRAL